jgi:glyoxylase-like metal-dependent hydrolase (beta-lactamase superfamily II)
MNVEIKLLQVLNGDCILVKINDGKSPQNLNIVIDTGFVSTYQRTLQTEVRSLLAKGEFIDLFIITHTHDDHISGIKPFLKEFGVESVNHFWFNWSPTPIAILDTGTEVGIKKSQS